MESPLPEVASPPVEEPPADESGEAHGDAWSCPICFMWFDMPVSPPCQHTFCAGVSLPHICYSVPTQLEGHMLFALAILITEAWEAFKTLRQAVFASFQEPPWV